MSYADETCKAAEVPQDSEIVKKLTVCLELVEGLHINISDLRYKLSPVTRMVEPSSSKSMDPGAVGGNTKVSETINNLEERIDSASRKVYELTNLVEV